MPHSILYYRQQLHFLGGMGIILLAVAILPVLGIGGMQLYRAETSGPIKTEKLRPRINHTAKALWYIYTGLVGLCALSFWCAGMSLFDAIGESFSAVSTGGFSVHDSNFAYYHSNLIDIIAIIFMLLGSTNFGLHYQFIHRKHANVYWKDPEFRAYIKILLGATLICAIILVIHHRFHFDQALLNSLFTVVSMESTTGYVTTDFSKWPTFLPFMIMFVTLIGGCGASAAGGIKVVRCLLLKKQGEHELKRLIHPQGVYSIKLGEQVLSASIMQTVFGFFAVFSVMFIVLFLLLLATGLDVTTSFSALTSCIANSGTALGIVATGFENISDASKWILIIAMLLGRLEIFTILVVLTPSYWRE